MEGNGIKCKNEDEINILKEKYCYEFIEGDIVPEKWFMILEETRDYDGMSTNTYWTSLEYCKQVFKELFGTFNIAS